MKVRSGALPSPRRVMKGLFSYPDVVIVCGPPQTRDEHTDILLNLQVIEVLSEATEAFDRGEKFQRYREHLPSLTDYILVAQLRAYVEHFTRQSAGRGNWCPVKARTACSICRRSIAGYNSPKSTTAWSFRPRLMIRRKSCRLTTHRLKADAPARNRNSE